MRTGVPLQDLRFVLLQCQRDWTHGEFWLIDVYDWDTVRVNETAPASLNFNLNLCSGAFPCSLTIKGNANGVIQRSGSGSISCLAISGCSSVIIENIAIRCQGQQMSLSVLKIQGSELSIVNSSFCSCTSASDGGVVLSYDRARVSISDSEFCQTGSSGFGGALVAFGSSINIEKSRFFNCSSELGGGAIWASAFTSAYGSSTQEDTSLFIHRSLFQNCTTQGGGGAILISSDSSSSISREVIRIAIQRSLFQQCYSSRGGGALLAAGPLVRLTLMDSGFFDCRSEASGGALSANDGELNLMHMVFKRNAADGLGGGALHLQDLILFIYDIHFEENLAIAGGGGAMFWQGNLYPSHNSSCPATAIDMIHECVEYSPSFSCSWRTCNTTALSFELSSNCSLHNLALYGPCIASDYKLLSQPRIQEAIFPGLPFTLVAFKKDAYNQTILSDSDSILQAYLYVNETKKSVQTVAFTGSNLAKYVQGKAVFDLSIRASVVDNLYNQSALQAQYLVQIEGSDSQTGRMMLSSKMLLALGDKHGICPSGYILEMYLGLWNGEAACSFCLSGTYSIDPLVSSPDSYNPTPSCIGCPAGGDCSQGGSIVQFQVGKWGILNGIYILQSCPAGYQLINSSSGGSAGLFSNELQQCRKCPMGKYIINSNTDECQSCPAGDSSHRF